jgi:hypothetical protein
VVFSVVEPQKIRLVGNVLPVVLKDQKELVSIPVACTVAWVLVTLPLGFELE